MNGITFVPGYFGWLGNQMFQYAAVFSLAKQLDADAYFPTNNPNIFDIFDLTAKKGSPELLGSFSYYREPEFSYTPLPKQTPLALHGYFQSEKYFKQYEEDIRREFSFKNEIDYDPNAVSIHVRRGDYCNLSKIHPPCGMDYYEAAMDKLPSNNYIVFSDDIEWCKQRFVGNKFTFSEHRSAEEDLFLMSKCRGNIIANSSFSWWAAWLSDNRDVIAPKKWFGSEAPHDPKDLVPERWTQI